MTKEKRPQDWSLEEKLQLIISCGSLDESAVSERCRQQGVYPHHLNSILQFLMLDKAIRL